MTDEIITTITSWYDLKFNHTGKEKVKPVISKGNILAITALLRIQTTRLGIGATRKSYDYIYIVVQFSPTDDVLDKFNRNDTEQLGGDIDNRELL